MAKVLCATCGIQTETGEEAKRLEFNGRVFFFCSEACLELFLADPTDYLGGAPEPDTRS
jgi:YHS domain-containing protein